MKDKDRRFLIMDKSNNIVTFVYKSSKKAFSPVLTLPGFIVILVMTVIAIFHRDFFMGLFAVGSFIMYIVILIYISADEYLIFNKWKVGILEIKNTG